MLLCACWGRRLGSLGQNGRRCCGDTIMIGRGLHLHHGVSGCPSRRAAHSALSAERRGIVGCVFRTLRTSGTVCLSEPPGTGSEALTAPAPRRSAAAAPPPAARTPRRPRTPSSPAWKSKFYGAFVLNHRVVLHAIDATAARWRGDAGSSPLDGASTAASSPRKDLVKNYRAPDSLVDSHAGSSAGPVCVPQRTHQKI